MAPRNDHAPRHGIHRASRGERERRNRNANTGAGINTNRSTVGRYGARSGDTYRPRYRVERAGHQAYHARNPPPRHRLVDRMTVGDNPRNDRVPAGRDHAPKSRPHNGRVQRLQDRISHDDTGGEGSSRDFQGNVDTRALAGHTTIEATNDEMGADMNTYTTHMPTDNSNFTPSSSLFYGSQPTQVPDVPQHPLTSSPPTPHHPVLPTTTNTPIRMLNQPVEGTTTPKHPERPINKYRGKDPIKRMVQNAKLRAIFADKPLPKQRKKALLDRPDLRIGISKVFK